MEAAKPIYDARLRRERAQWVLNLNPVTIILLVIASVALASMLYLNQTGVVVSTGYDISALEARARELERTRQRLLSTEAELHALSRVEREATQKLNMVPAPPPHYVPVKQVTVDVDGAVDRAVREAKHAPQNLWDRIAVLLGRNPTPR